MDVTPEADAMARAYSARVRPAALRRWIGALAVGAALVGCDALSPTPDPPPDAAEGADDRGPDDGPPTDAAPDRAVEPDAAPDRGSTPDHGPDGADDAGGGDAGPSDAEAGPSDAEAADAAEAGPSDAEVADAAPDLPDGCLEACDRYAACERLEATFGDRAECLAACRRVVHRGAHEAWFECLADEPCGLLHTCPLQGGRPLDCAEACDTARGCGADMPHCEANCAAAPAIAACADGLLDGRCALDRFAGCVVEALTPVCAADCDRGAGCGLVDRGACTADCVGDRVSGDPLGHGRSEARSACLAEVGADCEAIDRCVNPVVDPFADIDRDRFCALYDGCGLGAFLPCRVALRNIDPYFACGLERMALGCPFDAFGLIDACVLGDQPHPRSEPCRRLCEARDTCGVLGDASRAECVQRCLDAGDDADARAASDALLTCGALDRCDAVRACLDATGPAPECAAWCAALDGCGLADDDCPARCADDWARLRHRAARACVAAARDCDGVAACAPAPLPSCEAYCARQGPQACFFDTRDVCLDECDDLHFADPSQALGRIACTLTADRCGAIPSVAWQPPHDVLTCAFGDPGDHGLACAGFCTARGCRDPIDDRAACLQACGEGLVGDDGLRFVVGRACLESLTIGARCEEATACVPDALDVDCAALCARADGCGLSDPGCIDRCADDPLGRLRALRAQLCLPGVDDCDGVAGCLVPGPFEPDPGGLGAAVEPAAVCEAFAACPDAPQALVDCLSAHAGVRSLGGPAAPRCLLDTLEACAPGLPRLGRCFDHPLEAVCAEACSARRHCGLERLGQRRCEEQCRTLYDPEVPGSLDRAAPFLRCAAAPDCPTLADCIAAAEAD